MKRIYCWEPWFFIFFGLFHLHRIWGLFDRESYALFWMGILENKGIPYYVTMGVLALLCVAGIVVFVREIKHNYWWRWIYICGGSYVLFDLFAIATGMKFWKELLAMMFDTSSKYWNCIWMFFILLGGAVADLFGRDVVLIFRRCTATKLQKVPVEASEGRKTTVECYTEEGVVRVFDEIACFMDAQVIDIIHKGNSGVFNKGFGGMIIIAAAFFRGGFQGTFPCIVFVNKGKEFVN